MILWADILDWWDNAKFKMIMIISLFIDFKCVDSLLQVRRRDWGTTRKRDLNRSPTSKCSSGGGGGSSHNNNNDNSNNKIKYLIPSENNFNLCKLFIGHQWPTSFLTPFLETTNVANDNNKKHLTQRSKRTIIS